MSWQEGEAVLVYDPDEERWLPARVQSVGKIRHPSGLFDSVTVRTNETYDGLPLLIALPIDDPRIRRPDTRPSPRPSGSS